VDLGLAPLPRCIKVIIKILVSIASSKDQQKSIVAVEIIE